MLATCLCSYTVWGCKRDDHKGVTMVLAVLRGAFLVLVAAVTMLYLLPFQEDQAVSFSTVVLMLAMALAISFSVVITDIRSPKKNLSAGSGVFLGLLAGLLAAYAMSFVINLIGVIAAPVEMKQETGPIFNLLQGVKVLIGLVTCYIGITLVLQTKDDFRFVIPYVEFSREIRGNRPTLLDTSVIIDGRILDLMQTKLVQGTFIVPKFVLNELQAVADSTDRLRRARGRRGLDVLQKLQETSHADVSFTDADAEGNSVDQKLVSLAKSLEARVMTNDFNLNKIATLRGVDVINLNDVAKSLRPVVLPGEAMRVQLVKPGEGPTQAVGYLEDGTMVVVEGAKPFIGQDVELTVTSMLQTSAGRMIFGRYHGEQSSKSVPPGSLSPARKSHPYIATGDGHGADHSHGDSDHSHHTPPPPTGPSASAGSTSAAGSISPSTPSAGNPASPTASVTPDAPHTDHTPTNPAAPGPDVAPHDPAPPRPSRPTGFYGRNPRRGH